ncbi:MAG: hypothetical protein ACOYU4_10265 [Thermodesulfobacteriota bacterium]
MSLSLEQRIKKFKFSDMLLRPTPPESEGASETDERIDFSKVIKRKSSQIYYLPNSHNVPMGKTIAEEQVAQPLREEERQQLGKIDYRQDEIAPKTAEISQLQENYSVLQKELEAIKSTLASQTNIIQEQADGIELQSKEIAVLRRENEYYIEENRRKDKDLIDLKYNLQQKESEEERLRAGLQRLESDMELFRETLHKQQETEELQNQELENLRTARADLIRQQEAIQRQHKEEVASLQNNISEKETELNQHKEEVQTLKRELNLLKTSISDLQATEAELVNKKEEARRREEEFSILQSQATAKEEEARIAQEQTQILQADLSALQSELNKFQDIKEALEQQREDNAKQREEISRLQDEVAKKEAEGRELKTQSQPLQTELDALKANLTDKNRLIQEQIKTILELKEKTSALEVQHASERKKMLYDLQGIQQDKTALESRVLDYRQMASTLQTELQGATDKIDAINKKGAGKDRLIAFLCALLLVVSFSSLYMYRSNNQLVQELGDLSSTLEQKTHIIQSKIEKIESLNETIDQNAEVIKQQASKITTLNKNIRWQKKKIDTLNKALMTKQKSLTQKEEEVVKVRAELEETKVDFFLYRQKVNISDRANPLFNLGQKQRKQIGLLDKHIEYLESVLKDQTNIINAQAAILKNYSHNAKVSWTH